MNKPTRIVTWIAQIIAGVILLQTLFFKFTGAEESVYIFTTVGMEPWGRYGSAVAELIAAVLLLAFPAYAAVGGLIAMGVLSGAIFFHLTSLGIEVGGDGGLLFSLAITTFLLSAWVVYARRNSLIRLLLKIKGRA